MTSFVAQWGVVTPLPRDYATDVLIFIKQFQNVNDNKSIQLYAVKLCAERLVLCVIEIFKNISDIIYIKTLFTKLSVLGYSKQC